MKILKQKFYPKVGDKVEGVEINSKGEENIRVEGRVKQIKRCKEPGHSCFDRICYQKTFAMIKEIYGGDDYAAGVCLHYFDNDPTCVEWRLRRAKEYTKRTNKNPKV